MSPSKLRPSPSWLLQVGVRVSACGASIALALLTAAPAFAVGTQSTYGDEAQPIRKVEVFANSAMALTNTQDAVVYRLDGLQMLEAALSQGLPDGQAAASQAVQARMKAMGTALQERARNAAQGIALASQYGVDRIPAVVINGSAIVFGVTDVAEALRLYRQSPGRAPSRGGRP